MFGDKLTWLGEVRLLLGGECPLPRKLKSFQLGGSVGNRREEIREMGSKQTFLKSKKS